MIRIKKIDHIAICVNDVDEALAKYKHVLGLEPEVRELVASQKTEAVLLPIGDTSIELISPRGNEGLDVGDQVRHFTRGLAGYDAHSGNLSAASAAS